MRLSDVAIRNAKAPGSKPVKMFDGDRSGLFLEVKPSGRKLWRLKYHYLGKEKLISLGRYPEVSLKDARRLRDEARAILADGKDPSLERKRALVAAKLSAETTFSAIAHEFIDKREREGLKEVTVTKARWFVSLLDKSVGKRPIAEIEPYELLQAIKKIEAKGKRETAKRLLSFSSRVFRYGIATTRAKRNPAADLKGALTAPKVRHHPAILDPKTVGELLRAIDGYGGRPATKWALSLAPHVFLRPGELRQAEWIEFDFEKAVWRIPAGRMKMELEHVVPLSRQSLGILREAKEITGHGRYVFPAMTTPRRPLSENTLNQALRRLGFSKDQMTSHGFRTTASTLLNESGEWHPDAIERGLAHRDGSAVRGAYHRGAHWEERVRMAQWWSDYLDALREGTEIIELKTMPHIKSGA